MKKKNLLRYRYDNCTDNNKLTYIKDYSEIFLDNIKSGNIYEAFGYSYEQCKFNLLDCISDEIKDLEEKKQKLTNIYNDILLDLYTIENEKQIPF